MIQEILSLQIKIKTNLLYKIIHNDYSKKTQLYTNVVNKYLFIFQN